jgi:hypothetical protein
MAGLSAPLSTALLGGGDALDAAGGARGIVSTSRGYYKETAFYWSFDPADLVVEWIHDQNRRSRC